MRLMSKPASRRICNTLKRAGAHYVTLSAERHDKEAMRRWLVSRILPKPSDPGQRYLRAGTRRVCAVGYNGYIVEWQLVILQSPGALDTAAHRRTEQLLMPLVLFLPLLSLVIYFIPIYLLRRRRYARAQDYFVSSGHTPPAVIRNSSVAYALKMTTLGPFCVWGASGDFWPATIQRSLDWVSA